MFLSLLVWLSVSLILSEAAAWSRGPQTSLKDNGEASSLNGNGRTLGDIIFNVYAKNASMPSLLERMLADDVGKQTNHVRHEVRGSQPAAAQTVQSQSNGSMRKGVLHRPGQPFQGPPDAADVAYPQKGIGYTERELELFHQMFDKYLNFKAHRTGGETQDSRKELKSTCEKILQRKEKRAESGMQDHSSVTTAEADYSRELSMGDHYQMATRAFQNTPSQETNLFPSFETFVKRMFFPFAGLLHEAPSQEEGEGRDQATIRQEVIETDLIQGSPEMSPMADASGTSPAGLGTEPQTEEMTFTSTTMEPEATLPPDSLKDSSPMLVTETQTEVSISTTETHSGNSTTSTTPTAVFQTVSPFTPTMEMGDFSTPSKGYYLSTSFTELQNHNFPIPSKAPQRHSSGVPSSGPQQHGSPPPSEGPQQHGFPTISNGVSLRASLTPSERPQQHGSSIVPVGPQQLRSLTPSKGSYQHGFATHSKGLQNHSSPKPSNGPQQHRSSALSKGLAKQSLPIPARGPQQHGSPTPSKRPQKHGSPGPLHSAAKAQSDNGTADPPTQSSAGSETSYVLKEHLSSKGNEWKPPGKGLTMPKGKGILRRSLHIQEDEPKNVDDEYVVIEFVSTTSPPKGKRHEVGRIEETAESSNQSDIPLLEKLMKNLNEQFSRRAPTRNDVRNLEAAIERLNAALSELEKAEAPQVCGSSLTSCRRRAGQKEAAEPQRPQLKSERTGQADGALEEVVLSPEAIFTGGRAEREGGAQPYVSSGRRAPEKEAQEAKRQREVEGMFRRGDPSASDTSGLGNAESCADAVRPRDGSATRCRRSPLSRHSPPPNDARSRRTPKPSVKVSSPDIISGVKHSPLPISSTKRHWGPLHARGQQAPASSFIRPPVRAVSSKGPSTVSRGSPKRASLSLPRVRHSTPRTSSLSATPKPHILKGPSFSFRGNGKPKANVPAPAQRIPVNGTPPRPVKPLPASRSTPHSLRSSAHVIRHGSMYSHRNGPKPPIRKRSLPTRPPSPRKHNASFSLAHRPRRNQPANSLPSRRGGTPSNISDQDLSGNRNPQRGSQGASMSAPLKKPQASSRSSKPSGGAFPPGTGNRKSFLNSGIQLRDEPRVVSAGGADPPDQRVRASRPPRNWRRVNPSYRLIPPPEKVRYSDPSHRLRSPSPENVEFSNPSLRLDPPSPENVWLSNPYHSLNPPFPENAPISHPFNRLNSPSLGNVRSSSHSRNFRPSSPENRRTPNLSQSFNPPLPDIQSSRPSSRLLSAGSRISLNPSQGLRSSSSGNRRPLNRFFNLNPSSSGIVRSSESSRRRNPYSTGNMEHSNRRHTSHSQNLNTGYRQSSSPIYNLNPSLTENGGSSSVKGPPNSGEMSPKLPQRLSPHPPVKGRLSELFYKFIPSASAKERSHNPNPSSAVGELPEAIPDSAPQASSVTRQVPQLHFRLSQKAPRKTPSNSRGSISDASINRFSNPSRGPRLVTPGTRVPMLLMDDPSQISDTRCIHHVHYLKTPADRSSALRHPTPTARWDRAPFEESGIRFPTERAPPNPVATAPTRRFFQSMENVVPSSLNAPSLDIPIRRQVPRLYQSRGHRRPIGLSSNSYCDPNPVAPAEQTLLQVTSPPTFTDGVLPFIPAEMQEQRVYHREVVTAVAALHPQDAVQHVHDLYSPTSQHSLLNASTLVQNWRPLPTSTATTVKRSSTAKTSRGWSKHKHHRATSSESGKREVDDNETARLPKKKPSKTYRVKSNPDPVRKKLSKASPNPAPIVPGDNRPLDPPPNKFPSGPLYKKSWRPLLVSNPNAAPNEGSSLDPSDAHSQVSAADMAANRAPFLAVPNVGQIAPNHHGHRGFAPAVGRPSSSTMDLDHRGPLDHLGSRQALPPHGYAASSPRARSSRLSSSGRPPSDAIPNRLPGRRAYELLGRSIRSIEAGMSSWAFPSRRRTEVAPAAQRAPLTLASRRGSSPPSGPIPGHGSLAEAPHSPTAQGKLAASRRYNVPGPKVEGTM